MEEYSAARDAAAMKELRVEAGIGSQNEERERRSNQGARTESVEKPSAVVIGASL
jgi:hypothetical protein